MSAPDPRPRRRRRGSSTRATIEAVLDDPGIDVVGVIEQEAGVPDAHATPADVLLVACGKASGGGGRVRRCGETRSQRPAGRRRLRRQPERFRR